MGMGLGHRGGGVSRLESEKRYGILESATVVFGLEISLAGTCALSYRHSYI